MFYPFRKTKPVIIKVNKWFGLWSRNIILHIPQATIGETFSFSNMSDDEKVLFIIKKLAEWGAGREAYRLYCQLGEKIGVLLQESFFWKYNDNVVFPERVQKLADTGKKYNYDTPEGVLFSTIATEYHIPPKELLNNYTMDELSYFLNCLQYKNLNDKQKAELQKITTENELQNNKKEIEIRESRLENIFNQSYYGK